MNFIEIQKQTNEQKIQNPTANKSDLEQKKNKDFNARKNGNSFKKIVLLLDNKRIENAKRNLKDSLISFFVILCYWNVKCLVSIAMVVAIKMNDQRYNKISNIKQNNTHLMVYLVVHNL